MAKDINTASNKKKLAQFVSEKIAKKNEKIQEAGSSLSAKVQVLDSYSLVFNGALGALEAIGVPDSDTLAIQYALESVDSELDSMQKAERLARALNGDDEEQLSE